MSAAHALHPLLLPEPPNATPAKRRDWLSRLVAEATAMLPPHLWIPFRWGQDTDCVGLAWSRQPWSRDDEDDEDDEDRVYAQVGKLRLPALPGEDPDTRHYGEVTIDGCWVSVSTESPALREAIRCGVEQARADDELDLVLRALELRRVALARSSGLCAQEQDRQLDLDYQIRHRLHRGSPAAPGHQLLTQQLHLAPLLLARGARHRSVLAALAPTWTGSLAQMLRAADDVLAP